MNFVDAAIALLEEQKAPLAVEVLCQLALDRGLIDKPGAAPLRSMKGRLTSEANRGAESRLVRLEGDRWWLAGAEAASAPPADVGGGSRARADEAQAEVDQAKEAQAERAASPAAVPAPAEDDFEDDDDEPPGEVDSDDAGVGDFDEPEDDAELAADDLDDELDDLDDDDDDLDDDGDLDDDLDTARLARSPDGAADAVAATPSGLGARAATEALSDEDVEDISDADIIDAELGADDLDDEDGDDEDGDLEAAEPPRELTPEEVELEKIYGDESRATTPAAELAEYRDAQTVDEDRPMRPEILPDRGRGQGDRGRDRFRDRGRQGRGRGERRPEGEVRTGEAARPAPPPARDRDGQGGRPGAERREPREGRELGHEESGDRLTGLAVDAATPAGLAERATMVLASMKGGQPVPVRQLAQMMRKRRLVDDEPEKAWRPLKAALLHEQQRRQASGLSPRVLYRGRDLFAYRGPGGAVEAAEDQLETAMAAIATATRTALVKRLGELQLGALEQLAHLYLTALGYHGIDWLKRVDRSSYAVTREPGSSEPILVGVRAGDQPVDRRGVGELRAGVQAKNAARGLLLAPRELGDEAEAELERPGRPIAVLCGDAFGAALIRAGIGVQVRSVPIGFLDGELFDRLGDM